MFTALRQRMRRKDAAVLLEGMLRRLDPAGTVIDFDQGAFSEALVGMAWQRYSPVFEFKLPNKYVLLATALGMALSRQTAPNDSTHVFSLCLEAALTQVNSTKDLSSTDMLVLAEVAGQIKPW